MCTLTHFILFIAITPNRDDSCKYRIHHLMQYPKVVFKGTERERDREDGGRKLRRQNEDYILHTASKSKKKCRNSYFHNTTTNTPSYV